MRVNMKIQERSEKVSMFKSQTTQNVIADIQLSEEEKAAITLLKAQEYVLIIVPSFLPIDLKTLPDGRHVQVGALLSGRPLRLQYPDIVHAQQGMEELKQKLTGLKTL